MSESNIFTATGAKRKQMPPRIEIIPWKIGLDMTPGEVDDFFSISNKIVESSEWN